MPYLFATVFAAFLTVEVPVGWGITVLSARFDLSAFAVPRFTPSAASPSPTPPTQGSSR